MGRPRMADAAKPKHVLSFRATDAEREYLEERYGKAAQGLQRLVREAMNREKKK